MSLENVKSLVSAIAGSVTLRWRFHRVQLGKTSHVATAPKKRTVGTPLSDAIYQVAHEWAYSRFITNMAVIERDDDQVTLELCHTWRITRTPPVAEPDSPQTPVWTFKRWNPLEGLWEDVEASHIPALPLFQRGRGGLAKNLIGQACAHYTACAVTSLRAEFVRLGYTDEDINDGTCLARDILCEDRVRHKERYEPLAVAGGIVGAAIWQLLDRPSVSHAFRVYPMGELRLQEYLVVERHGAALDKIHREHPNAMPILRGIDPRHWGDANLFAYYRWADIRTTPLIGQRQISSKLAWKAFIAAPATAHSAWMRAALSENSWLPFDLLYEVLGRCRRPAKATWISKVILAWRTRTEWLYTTSSRDDYTSLAHLCDSFFAHAATLSRKPGATVASQLDPSEMANILDWWADDGRKRALPDAQSTWASIARQVVRWERAKREGDPNKRWQSALGQTTIDDVLVVPLASEPELVKEGSEMHHCVGTYARVCMTHGHRIFSLRAGAERSTLRIVPHGDEWHVGENLAQCNEPPAPELLAIGRKVAAAYALASAPALPAAEPARSELCDA
ncbi:PcfJ domain-containing protein (plasmid) [Robbsia andropogonis]|uniref:PcfJ domain-containing protein n=1 Tax=Robbsia andropogonis TaxID=28092 RepID=UPI003D2483D5